jgi:hypothetical protein
MLTRMPVALRLELLPGRYAVVRLDEDAPLPAWAFAAPGLAAVVRRRGELSVVCVEDAVPAGAWAEPGWRALEVVGPLDFTLTGVLAALAAPLADAGVSIFALATYDTDVLLVRDARLEAAIGALQGAGHVVSRVS